MNIAAWVVIAGFVVGIVLVGVWLRIQESDGAFDVPPGAAARPGLKRLFDFGPGGWSDDGIRQRPANPD